MMGKIHIFAKPNLTRICVRQTVLAIARRFAQLKQLFSRRLVKASLEWSINAAMAVVVVCLFALLSSFIRALMYRHRRRSQNLFCNLALMPWKSTRKSDILQIFNDSGRRSLPG